MKMRLLVCGGRKFTGRHRLWYEMNMLIDGYRMSDVTIIHGACPTGADQFAHEFYERWAQWGLLEEPYPAKWRDLNVPGAVIRHRNGVAYNFKAGFQRNQTMLDVGKPTHALVAPGGGGTADMRRRLEAAIEAGTKIELRTID
jgi:hypothetical protein